ncbi:MAG: hypothetical protein HQM04_08425 [Magnetococcales bacterium]|nr:hypothetical protein [Magnetococcales bacterium]MBF0115057.1 hypothetical protein [Magnetococcales bacterium]
MGVISSVVSFIIYTVIVIGVTHEIVFYDNLNVNFSMLNDDYYKYFAFGLRAIKQTYYSVIFLVPISILSLLSGMLVEKEKSKPYITNNNLIYNIIRLNRSPICFVLIFFMLIIILTVSSVEIGRLAAIEKLKEYHYNGFRPYPNITLQSCDSNLYNFTNDQFLSGGGCSGEFIKSFKLITSSGNNLIIIAYCAENDPERTPRCLRAKKCGRGDYFTYIVPSNQLSMAQLSPVPPERKKASCLEQNEQ